MHFVSLLTFTAPKTDTKYTPTHSSQINKKSRRSNELLLHRLFVNHTLSPIMPKYATNRDFFSISDYVEMTILPKIT